jgi:hypothetical protein
MRLALVVSVGASGLPRGLFLPAGTPRCCRGIGATPRPFSAGYVIRGIQPRIAGRGTGATPRPFSAGEDTTVTRARRPGPPASAAHTGAAGSSGLACGCGDGPGRCARATWTGGGMSIMRMTAGIRPARRHDCPGAAVSRQQAGYRCGRGHDSEVTFTAGAKLPQAAGCRRGAPVSGHERRMAHLRGRPPRWRQCGRQASRDAR